VIHLFEVAYTSIVMFSFSPLTGAHWRHCGAAV